MALDDLSKVSYLLGHTAASLNWKCAASVTLTFATINEYAAARADIYRGMVPSRDGIVRAMPDGYGEVMDICGVTFIIRCTQKRISERMRLEYSDVEMLRNGEFRHRRSI